MQNIKKISFLLAAFILTAMVIINGCGGKGGDTPPPPPNPCANKTITVTGTVTNTPTGQSVGAINATGAGSTGFTYQLNTGAFQASGTFSGLAAGTYTVTAKDADGCTGSNSFTVVDPCTIKNIDITAVIVNTLAGTSNGSITATGTNSTGFTYSRDGGNFQASGVFTGLAVGNYNITVKDVEGCTKTKQFAVLDICAAKTITITGTVVNAGPVAGVANGSINASAAGSTGFTYQLGAGTFQASGNFTALAAGTYNITAKDAEGCTKSQSFTLAYDPCIGKSLNISATSTPSDKCASTGTGTITITGTGGTGFTYQLGTGAFQVSNIFNNVAVNTYAIAVKDADGCVKTGSTSVAALPAGPLFTAVQAVIQTNCALSGCHSGNFPTGGLNFTDDCTIVGSWDRIKARAVDAPTTMPPAPRAQLSAADKQKVLDWITAGHNHTN